MSRTPVYFVSHGGPTTMYDTIQRAYSRLESIGREITQRVKPSAILVFSAHWQAKHPKTIEANTSEGEPCCTTSMASPSTTTLNNISIAAHRN